MVLVIATAVVLTVARALLPQADRYRSQIETEVSQLIGQPLTIADFELGWHGLGPRVYLKRVEIVARDGNRTLLSFQQAHVDIALWSSLRSGEPDFGAFTLAGLELNLVRHEDGSLGLEGIDMPGTDEGAAINAGRDAVLDWLWRQGHLALEQSVIRLRDMRAGGRLWRFDEVYLHLRNSGQRARLSGSMELPDQVGRALEFVLEVDRRGRAMADWEGDLYLKGERLVLPVLSASLELPVTIEKGQLAGQVWGQWRGGALVDLRGDVQLNGVRLLSSVGNKEAAARQFYDLAYFSTRFVWQGSRQKGVVDLDQLQLHSSVDVWPATRAHFEYSRGAGALTLEGGLTFARLEDLVPLALLTPLPEGVAEALAALRPEGEVSSTFFRFSRQAEQSPEFFLQTSFTDLGVSRWRDFPAANGLDGSLNLDHRSGVIDLSTRNGQLDSAGLFRELLPLSSLDGRLAWARFGQGLHIDIRRVMIANDDLAGEVEGHLFFPEEASPQISLVAQLDYADGVMTGRYLPTRVMSTSTVKWLDKAILNGFVTDAIVLLHGPLKRFPFDHGEGHFEVRANLIDGVLDYAAGWPRMEQVEAELVFRGRTMAINGHRAEMLNSELEDVRVAIRDMHANPVVLEISGRVRGGTEDVVSYLNTSPPLYALFGSFLGDAEASGQSDLRLDLKLPLGPGMRTEVQGVAVLDNSAIEFKKLGVDLTAINGKLLFDNRGLWAEKVALNVVGQPAVVAISNQGNGHRTMVFEADGRTDYSALEQRFGFIPVFGYMAGESRWQALLTIPRDAEDGSAINLNIKSDLVGSTVLLPQPLGKTADLPRPFLLEGWLGDHANRWHFDYDQQRLTGLFESPHQGVLAGELYFSGEAPAPTQPGIRVAGKLDFFSEEAWWPILFGDSESAAASSTTAADDGGVNRLAVEVARADLFGLSYDNLWLDATKEGGIWAANVTSDQLRGKLFIPEDWRLPLEATLDYLYLPVAGSDRDTASGVQNGGGLHDFDPAILPPIRLTSKEFDYGGESLGQLRLVTEQRLNGLSIEVLELDSSFAKISGEGAWNYVGGQHNSIFGAKVETSDFGKLLSALDFGGMIEGGRGHGSFSLRWNAPLLEMEPMLLNGTVNIDFRDGSILEVDPGAGRVFSLLSPRRLLLDFRDMSRGLAFDKMRGRFDIRSGNAFTQNFMLDGPVAKVEARGRIGLGAEDYDQSLVVTPHVTSSLPLIGAVVQGSLGVGAVVLLAERLLKPVIDEASRMRYVVTGSWDDPQVTPLDLSEEQDPNAYLPELLRDD